MINRIEFQPPPEIHLTDSQREALQNIQAWSKAFFQEAERTNRVVMGSHGFDHNQRVAGMAAVIAHREDYEPFLPILTALVFDIGRTSNDPRAHNYLHGQLSVEMASHYIDRITLLTPADRLLVKNAIEDHPKLNQDVRESYVVKVVQDADRLDIIGALAPVRAAATRWRLPLFTDNIVNSWQEQDIKTIYQDFAIRIPRWYYSLWTETAKQIAAPRLSFLLTFIEEFQIEAGFMLAAYRKIGI